MIKNLRQKHRLALSKGSRKLNNFLKKEKSQLWSGPKYLWPHLSAPVCSLDLVTSLITDQRKLFLAV